MYASNDNMEVLKVKLRDLLLLPPRLIGQTSSDCVTTIDSATQIR
jgi:hypothetical protein